MNTNEKPKGQNKISRKDAIKRLGLTAASAATLMMLLNDPSKGQDTGNSPDAPPEWP